MSNYNPRMSNTTSYQPPPLRPAPTVFPTAPMPQQGGGGGGLGSLMGGVSSLMGGPAGIALSGISAIGGMLSANAQRKEAKRQFNQTLATGDNQFAAQHGLSRNSQDVDRKDLLLQRQREEDQLQRYLANQRAKSPMMQALLARLGGIAGSGGLASVAAPGRIADLSGLTGAANERLGTYTPYKTNRQGHTKGVSTYNPVA